MIIEDDELRELYQTSSTEHLQKLEADLMLLEKNPQDLNAIEEFLREAHTLKGDSRMLGLNDIEMLVHQLEDCVETVKAGKEAITSQLCDRLYQGIDAVNQLAHQAITGEQAEVNTLEILALLMGAESASPLDLNTNDNDLFGDESSLFDDKQADLLASPSNNQSFLFDATETESDSFVEAVPITSSSQPVKTPAAARDYQIDTIRVEPKKLDTLMTHASELAVTKLRIAEQINEIEKIGNLWSEWTKNHSRNSSSLDQIEATLDRLEKIIPAEKFYFLRYFFYDAQQRLETLGNLFSDLKSRANEDVSSLSIISDRLESGIQELRELPLATVFNLFPRMVRDLARQQGKEIDLVIEGGDTKADKRILEEIKDPLLHLLRNAIDHGIETPEERANLGKPTTATIWLRGYQTGSSIGIEISDDGRGLNLDSIKSTALRRKMRTEAELATMSEAQIHSLIFASGFSTRTEVTELSGRGVGLDVVRANIERLKGSIQVTSTPGKGCKFQVRLVTSLATTQVLIVELDNTRYAIPVEYIQTMLTIYRQDMFVLEGSKTITFDEQPTSIGWLADLLQLPRVQPKPWSNNQALSCIILQTGRDLRERFGIIVDNLIDRQDVVLKPQSKLLKRIPNIAGATILGSGEVCMILNPLDLLHSLRKGTWQNTYNRAKQVDIKHKLLLVEDSIIIRTQMQRLLQGAGYDVIVAVDGKDGLDKLQSESFALVVSDVEMPNMTGLELTANIRKHPQYQELPVILVTTLASPEDKRRGAEAGANAYLTKGDFEQKRLLDTINQLIS